MTDKIDDGWGRGLARLLIHFARRIKKQMQRFTRRVIALVRFIRWFRQADEKTIASATGGPVIFPLIGSIRLYPFDPFNSVMPKGLAGVLGGALSIEIYIFK